MLAIVRFTRPVGADDFRERAEMALAALAQRPGYRWGSLSRAVDDPDRWVLATAWESVGAYRRALSSWEVKLRAHPFLLGADDEVSAFEELVEVDADGVVSRHRGDLAQG